jgi:hypothetical protein
MVLHDIADDAELVEVASTALGAERLLEGDLNVVDVVTVPGGAQEGVAKAHDQDVLDHLLAQVVVDTEDLFLLPVGLQGLLELTGAGQVLAERLLDLRAVVREPVAGGGGRCKRELTMTLAIPFLG